MKSMIAAVAFCACCAAMAAKGGNVCTWTGGGYDARWSNAANWDVLPASGNGDTLGKKGRTLLYKVKAFLRVM